MVYVSATIWLWAGEIFFSDRQLRASNSSSCSQWKTSRYTFWLTNIRHVFYFAQWNKRQCSQTRNVYLLNKLAIAPYVQLYCNIYRYILYNCSNVCLAFNFITISTIGLRHCVTDRLPGTGKWWSCICWEKRTTK